jgi:hypothetical protein
MTACPDCGSSTAEARDYQTCPAPVWAQCRDCGWPLKRAAMLERLRLCRAEVRTVVIVENDDAGVRTMAGAEALDAVDELVSGADAAIPVCEAAGLVAFRRASAVEFFLFEGESVHNALSAMAGL